ALVVIAIGTAIVGIRAVRATETAATATKQAADATGESVRCLDLAMRVDSILRLDDQLNGSRVCDARAKAAAAFLAGNRRPIDVDDVLDFFEIVGLLLERGAIDEEMAWAFFSPWVFHYVHGFGDYVATSCQDDPAAWEHVRPLFERFLQIEARRTGRTREAIIPSDDALRRWFESEAKLSPGAQAQAKENPAAPA